MLRNMDFGSAVEVEKVDPASLSSKSGSLLGKFPFDEVVRNRAGKDNKTTISGLLFAVPRANARRTQGPFLIPTSAQETDMVRAVGKQISSIGQMKPEGGLHDAQGANSNLTWLRGGTCRRERVSQ
jgi:hypothetical protein